MFYVVTKRVYVLKVAGTQWRVADRDHLFIYFTKMALFTTLLLLLLCVNRSFLVTLTLQNLKIFPECGLTFLKTNYY